jgi:hypothetical protein
MLVSLLILSKRNVASDNGKLFRWKLVTGEVGFVLLVRPRLALPPVPESPITAMKCNYDRPVDPIDQSLGGPATQPNLSSLPFCRISARTALLYLATLGEPTDAGNEALTNAVVN